MADPRRMTPEEHGEAHALLVKAVTDPDWRVASQALDDLMRKLLVVHRAAGGRGAPRHAAAAGRPHVTAAAPPALLLAAGPRVRAVSRYGPPGGSRRL